MFRPAAASLVRQSLARRAASTVAADSAVSRAVLADVPARWTTMAQPERTAVVDSLLAAQKGDWKALSAEQKKALFYIAYGPHGQRERLPKGFQIRVLLATLGVVGVSGALFYWIRVMGGERLTTQTKEWQEAANEYSRSMNANPYTGVSSDNYKGKGHVSSL